MCSIILNFTYYIITITSLTCFTNINVFAYSDDIDIGYNLQNTNSDITKNNVKKTKNKYDIIDIDKNTIKKSVEPETGNINITTKKVINVDSSIDRAKSDIDMTNKIVNNNIDSVKTQINDAKKNIQNIKRKEKSINQTTNNDKNKENDYAKNLDINNAKSIYIIKNRYFENDNSVPEEITQTTDKLRTLIQEEDAQKEIKALKKKLKKKNNNNLLEEFSLMKMFSDKINPFYLDIEADTSLGRSKTSGTFYTTPSKVAVNGGQNTKNFGITTKYEYQISTAFGLGFNISNYVRTELQLSYIFFGNQSNRETNYTGGTYNVPDGFGSLRNIYTMSMNIIFDTDKRNTIYLSAGGGIGAAYLDFNSASSFSNDFTLTYNALAQINFRISDNMVLYTQYKAKIFQSHKFQGSNENFKASDTTTLIDTNYVMPTIVLHTIGVGIRIFFS